MLFASIGAMLIPSTAQAYGTSAFPCHIDESTWSANWLADAKTQLSSAGFDITNVENKYVLAQWFGGTDYYLWATPNSRPLEILNLDSGTSPVNTLAGLKWTTGTGNVHYVRLNSSGAYVSKNTLSPSNPTIRSMGGICGYAGSIVVTNIAGRQTSDLQTYFPYANTTLGTMAFRPNPSSGGTVNSNSAITDATTSSLKANVADLANSNALKVALVDTNGDLASLTSGGGAPISAEDVAQVLAIGIACVIVFFIIKQFAFRGVG